MSPASYRAAPPRVGPSTLGEPGARRKSPRREWGAHPRRLAPYVTLLAIPLQTIEGEPTTLGAHPAKAMLLVNVASRCGLTPQYDGLERLQKEYADQGFRVLGFPCNQFR